MQTTKRKKWPRKQGPIRCKRTGFWAEERVEEKTAIRARSRAPWPGFYLGAWICGIWLPAPGYTTPIDMQAYNSRISQIEIFPDPLG